MKMIPVTCHKCSKVIDRPKKEVDRQIRNGRQYFFCSLSCSASQTTHEKIISKCLFCNKEFETTTHKHARKCCNNTCARKFSTGFNTYDIKFKNKLSSSIKKCWDNGLYGGRRPPKEYEFTCIICNSLFKKKMDNWRRTNNPPKTCSDKCYRERLRQLSRANPNCGGETNYKKYKYNNIWMDSTWEVELAKWMDNKNIKWERSRKLHQFMWTDKDGNSRRYYPDFYLPDYNIYLDPKNKYLKGIDEDKITRVIQENKIKLVWGLLENVKKEIDILVGM